MDFAERFWSHTIRRLSGCLEWTLCTDGHGYGSIRVGGKLLKAHRLAWQLTYGPIPAGQVIRHFVCDNPLCCEPTHLRPGTQSQNVADMMDKGRHGTNGNEKKTHCPQGHEYTWANTYLDVSGWRHCRKCGNESSRVRRQARVIN